MMGTARNWMHEILLKSHSWAKTSPSCRRRLWAYIIHQPTTSSDLWSLSGVCYYYWNRCRGLYMFFETWQLKQIFGQIQMLILICGLQYNEDESHHLTQTVFEWNKWNFDEDKHYKFICFCHRFLLC